MKTHHPLRLIQFYLKPFVWPIKRWHCHTLEFHFADEDHRSFVKQYVLIFLFCIKQKVPYELLWDEPGRGHGKIDLRIDWCPLVLLPGRAMSKFHSDHGNQEYLKQKQVYDN